MRSWLALRLACAAALPVLLFTMFPACGARTSDWAEGGGGAASGCRGAGETCADAPCCGDLLCASQCF